MSELQVVAGLYVLASLCVVYKLAFLIRQSACLPSSMVFAIRLVGVLAGTNIIVRIIGVTMGDVAVEVFDVTTQLAWCFILYCGIVALGRKKQVW